ncbi:flavodoxin family protein [Desulfosporosinus sp. BICA1-9]|uniref:flavodoxin family protein n=1 Tax=Desulfosporosinus sp. BICA1-9 TaxID=1531958 RepID=UPI00054B341D|nr:flavodoxin family protein [Desulfosporosinus sp. BICA1-9]KJS49723.1 MAG: NADPH-dependent FMN reductase [Peptococcaceae bacterium BRH_c23]KJS88297.1 MAG: NADPH-dependent FMN reductase [Desulfosporosinus sp. BICA1-9]HBW35966.1 flavodoxin family protein [Desulfosporosinus sp.]
MKRILGLVASQRKTANGEILLKEAAAAAGDEYELELIRLAEWRFEPCRGCFTCLLPDKSCPIDDDLYPLADKIKAADGIILASPCYALGPASVTKLIGDRIIALNQLLEDFWGKPCVIIATAGNHGWEGYTLSALITTARNMGLGVKDACMFIGALPGEAVLAEGVRGRVRLLGSRLFDEARPPEEGECPSCWADIWKFPQPGIAICSLCGQVADLIAGRDGVIWIFGPRSDRQTKEGLVRHNQELKGKVKEYFSRREELTVVRKAYKGEDNWLKPRTK